MRLLLDATATTIERNPIWCADAISIDVKVITIGKEEYKCLKNTQYYNIINYKVYLELLIFTQ